jgi:hypothetical protein
LLPGSRKAAGNPSVEVSWPHRAHDSPCCRRAAEGSQALPATGFGGGGRDFQAPRVIDPPTRSEDTNTSPHRFEVVMTTGQFPVGRNCQGGGRHLAQRRFGAWRHVVQEPQSPPRPLAGPGTHRSRLAGKTPFRRTGLATGDCGAFLRPLCVPDDPQTSPRGQFRPVRGGLGPFDLLSFCPDPSRKREDVRGGPPRVRTHAACV